MIVGREAQIRYHRDQKSHVVYNLKEAILKDERFALGPDTFLAVSLVSELLRVMKQNVQIMTGTTVTRAVMTVPSFFSELHKGALKDAATLTGIVDVQLISEPTAALIYYQSLLSAQKIDENESKRNVLLLDSGGLTTDATLCQVGPQTFQIRGVHGDNAGGCYQVDRAISQLIATSLLAETDYSIADIDSRQLQAVSEGVKIQYNCEDVTIDLPLKNRTNSIKMTLKSEALGHRFEKYLDSISRVYQEIKKAGPIDQILLIGGPFQSSYIKDSIKATLAQKVVDLRDYGFVVARGAAIFGQHQAMGSRVGVRDLVPMPIGVEVGRGHFSRIVPPNALCPSSHKKIFTTTEDNQKKIRINIFQGSRLMVKDCYYLGSVVLDDLVLADAGVPEIEVSLDITEEGLLSVRARDLIKNTTQSKVISAENRLDELSKILIQKQLEKYHDVREHRDKINLSDIARSWLYRLESRKNLSPLIVIKKEALKLELERVPVDYEKVKSLLEEISHHQGSESCDSSLPSEK